MSKPVHSLNSATSAFLDALCAYQAATLDMNRSLLRLHRLIYAFNEPLKDILATTGAAVIGARPQRQARGTAGGSGVQNETVANSRLGNEVFGH